jgi:hypothetical protein
VIPPYRVAAAAPRAAPGGHRHRGHPRRRGPPTNSGDAAPREALFLAADHARRADPSLAARYYRLMVSQGKHHNSALCHSSAALLTRYRSHAWAAALAATATTHKRTRPYTPQPSGSTARWPRMGLRPRLHHRSRTDHRPLAARRCIRSLRRRAMAELRPIAPLPRRALRTAKIGDE